MYLPATKPALRLRGGSAIVDRGRRGGMARFPAYSEMERRVSSET